MNRYLFVIDYQKDFVDGALGFPGAEKLDEGIAAKVRAYGKGHVLFTRDTHFENYLNTREGKNLPVVHCIQGTPGWECYGETARALAEVEAPAIDKLVFGMDVTDPATAAVLPQQADEIELVGLCTDICVVTNALLLKTALPETKISVDAACCAGVTPKSHEAALLTMRMCQVEVKM